MHGRYKREKRTSFERWGWREEEIREVGNEVRIIGNRIEKK